MLTKCRWSYVCQRIYDSSCVVPFSVATRLPLDMQKCEAAAGVTSMEIGSAGSGRPCRTLNAYP
jgi:hypothetical protein